MTIGLKITENVATSLGLLANTMIRVRTAEGQGKSETHKKLGVLFDVFESRARFDAGDNPLQTAAFNHRRNIEILNATEVSETSTHQALKTVLEAEGLTITEETVA